MRKDIFPKISTISKAAFLSLNMMYINAMNEKLKNKNAMNKNAMYINAMNKKLKNKNVMNKNAFNKIAKNRKKENKFFKKNEEKKIKNNFFNIINSKIYCKKPNYRSSNIITYGYGDSIKTDDRFESYFKISNDDIYNLKNKIQNKLKFDEELRNSVYKLDKNEKGYYQKRHNITKEIDKNNQSLAELVNKYVQELKRIDRYGTNKPKDMKGYRDFLEEIAKKLIAINSLYSLLDINSKFIIEKILDILPEKKKLELIKYNKEIQKRLDIDRKKEYFKYYLEISINNTVIFLCTITQDLKFEILNNLLNKLKNFKNLEVKIVSPYNCFRSFEKMFYNHNNITKIDISNFYTDKVENFSYMFAYCKNLEEIDISNFNTSNVKNMSFMFENCENLKKVIGFSGLNTKNVTDMHNMFSECSSLKELDLSYFNTENVTDMKYMFFRCKSLEKIDLSSFNTQNVTSMIHMFSGCEKLKELDLSSFNTKNVTIMHHMFSYCTGLKELNLSNFNTINVTDMSNMFSECSFLTNLDLSNFNTENVINLSHMFYFCTRLKELDLSSFNTKNVTDMHDMFSYCFFLKELNLSNFNIIKVTDMSDMFAHCGNLKKDKVIGPDNIKGEIK